MATIEIGSARSCGVTTTALALLSVWPSPRQVLLAELDPSGGTLSPRLGLSNDPGLVTLAAVARRGLDGEAVAAQAQALDRSRSVLVGPPSARQAATALSYLAGLPAVLQGLAADVLVDRGRVDPAHLGAEGASWRVWCVRPVLADLMHLADLLEHEEGAGRSEIVLVGAGPYGPQEVEDALGLAVAGALPWDPAGSAGLAGAAQGRVTSRSPLARAARALAGHLVEVLDDRPAPRWSDLPPPPVSKVETAP